MVTPSREIRQITAEQTYPIRLDVLRPGRPLSEAIFAGDNDPETVHFGAFENGEQLGIASLYRAPFPHRPDVTDAWQLRGMATLPRVQGKGFGRALVDACIDHARAQGGRILWCNARSHAAGFYERAGFQVSGEEFHIPDVGPHFRMWLRL